MRRLGKLVRFQANAQLIDLSYAMKLNAEFINYQLSIINYHLSFS